MYGTVSRAFKAGGFNPVSIPGSESYDEEHAWNIEGGVKTTVGQRQVVRGGLGVLHRLGRPAAEPADSGRAGQFYIANVGSATSRGAEFELDGPSATTDWTCSAASA